MAGAHHHGPHKHAGLAAVAGVELVDARTPELAELSAVLARDVALERLDEGLLLGVGRAAPWGCQNAENLRLALPTHDFIRML
jgi:hypothetical protein